MSSNRIQKMLSATLYVILGIVLVAAVILILPVYQKYRNMQTRVARLEQEDRELWAEYQTMLKEVHDLESDSLAVERVRKDAAPVQPLGLPSGKGLINVVKQKIRSGFFGNKPRRGVGNEHGVQHHGAAGEKQKYTCKNKADDFHGFGSFHRFHNNSPEQKIRKKENACGKRLAE